MAGDAPAPETASTEAAPRAPESEPSGDPPPRPPTRLADTWGLGVVSTMLLAFVGLTGVGLLFVYRPVPELAAVDILDLREASRFGFLREWHVWGSHAVLVVVVLHLLRVFLTGAYRPPRHRNWLVGVALLVLTAALAFTGTLLPWSHDGWWAVHASLGGMVEPGPGTLHLFYVAHCFLLPVLVVLLVLDHLRRARRDGAEG